MNKYEIIKHSIWLQNLLEPDKKLVLELVERATPNIVKVSVYGIEFCPICNKPVWQSEGSNFCFTCGQALKRSDSNGKEES